MNVKDYISSGILEMYAMGQLGPAEAKEVEAMSRKHPAVAEELRAVQDAMIAYGGLSEKTPGAGLEERILRQLDTPPKQPHMPGKKTGINGTRLLTWGLLLASVIGLAYFFQKNNANKKELENTRAELAQLKQDCAAVQAKNQRATAYLEKVNAPGNDPISLLGTDNAPGAYAVVHWNKKAKKSYLEIKDLPPAPAGKQYQLWAIVDGTPTDMGVFDISTEDLALTEVPYIDRPQAFAVTLEKQGGSPVPSLDQMVLIGNI